MDEMSDTFRDGIEAAAQLVEDEDCTFVGRAWLRDIAAKLRALTPPSTELVVIDSLEAKFIEFQHAFLSAGGYRQPRSIEAKGWGAARKVFLRLVKKQKHDPDAIVTGTLAFAGTKPEPQYVPAPEVFLNREGFTKNWDQARAVAPKGNQNGATSLFDIGFGHR